MTTLHDTGFLIVSSSPHLRKKGQFPANIIYVYTKNDQSLPPLLTDLSDHGVRYRCVLLSQENLEGGYLHKIREATWF